MTTVPPDPQIHAAVTAASKGTDRIVVLTGAGVSAQSGIPTFRGKEGYWTVKSRVYHPQELATWQAFSTDPTLVWPWYLYRRSICRKAQPNAGHKALVQMEELLKDRFVLVTQNVDGLHLRAGNSTARTWEIHGNIDHMRCAQECHRQRLPVPDLGTVSRGEGFQPEWQEALRCEDCNGWMRPHVLWFDECYDEERYRFESAQRVVHEADLLIVAGTAGATTLPSIMSQIARARGIPVVDINPEPNPFTPIAQQSTGGWIQGPAAEAFVWLEACLREG